METSPFLSSRVFAAFSFATLLLVFSGCDTPSSSLRPSDGDMERLTAPVALHDPVFIGTYCKLNEVSVKPTPASALPPEFPIAMRLKNTNGEATIAFIVNPQGNVEQAQVVSATQQAFGDAALKAVKAWVFTPAQKDGARVSCVLFYPLKFNMND